MQIMPLKHLLRNWAHKFICGWLIVCVGGVAPLTFNTPLSPHRDVPTIYIAFIDSPPPSLFNVASSDPIASILKQVWKTQGFNPNSTGHTLENFMPGVVRFFQSNLSNGYLLTRVQPYSVFHLSLCGLITLYLLNRRSALLSPLEKPPQSLLA